MIESPVKDIGSSQDEEGGVFSLQLLALGKLRANAVVSSKQAPKCLYRRAHKIGILGMNYYTRSHSGREETDRQTDTDRQTERQTDRDRQKDRQTETAQTRKHKFSQEL